MGDEGCISQILRCLPLNMMVFTNVSCAPGERRFPVLRSPVWSREGCRPGPSPHRAHGGSRRCAVWWAHGAAGRAASRRRAALCLFTELPVTELLRARPAALAARSLPQSCAPQAKFQSSPHFVSPGKFFLAYPLGNHFPHKERFSCSRHGTALFFFLSFYKPALERRLGIGEVTGMGQER